MTKRDHQKTRGGKRPPNRKRPKGAGGGDEGSGPAVAAAPKRPHRKGQSGSGAAKPTRKARAKALTKNEGKGVRQRRALSHVGGALRREGDPGMAKLLAKAAQPPETSDPRRITHGFHSWPARLHPFTAGGLIAASPAGPIADPFMGGGTVLVESMIAGRRCLGSDVNPVAIEVAWARTRVWSREQVTSLVPRTEAIVNASRGRRKQRLPKDLWERERDWFDPPALADLWSIIQTIDALPSDDPFRRMLRVMVSSLLIKSSKQVSDSVVRQDNQHRFVPNGRVDQWLVARAREHRDGLKWLARADRSKREPTIALADARRPPAAAGDEEKFAAIVSSPPYPGIYDYVAHHQRRYSLLGLGPELAADREIGARREMRKGREAAVRSYVKAMGDVLTSWRPRLRDDALVHLVVGDGQDDNGTIAALPLIIEAGAASGFSVLASVSQPRPTFGPKRRVNAPKEEHIITLQRDAGTGDPGK